jgi:undecaprenyl pyrophosphate synthase
MRLLRRYARQERDELKRQGVEVRVYGDLDRLAPRRGGPSRRSRQHTRAAGTCSST